MSSDRQSYRGSERTSAVSSLTQKKPRKTLTYAEQLQSLQQPKDTYYNKPSMTSIVVTHQLTVLEIISLDTWISDVQSAKADVFCGTMCRRELRRESEGLQVVTRNVHHYYYQLLLLLLLLLKSILSAVCS